MLPDALYDDWIAMRERSSHEPLTRQAARPYRHIWELWCRWLGEPDLQGHPRAASYLDVAPETVARFLRNGPSPNSTRSEAGVSDVTRGRYRVVLRELYEHAVGCGLIGKNPVPRPNAQEHAREFAKEAQILSSLEWEAIYRELPAGSKLLEVRDRAILLLLLEEALTPGEIKGLTMRQVRPDLLRPGMLSLEIEGKRKAQARSLPLGEASSRALQTWLDRRHEAPGATDLPSGWVFLSRRAVPLSDRTLFKVVGDVILRASGTVHMPAQRHIGPQVLRNTRIVFWLREGMPEPEVVHRAGYKDATSFRGLLAHFRHRDASAPAPDAVAHPRPG
ncbi:MAG: tyrosine-type recombinase/integrase [Xylophilus ampelinus]